MKYITMKLTREILTKLGFENKGKIWSKFILDLTEDESDIFTFDVDRIYQDIETVKQLGDIWKIIGAEEQLHLEIEKL